MKRTGLRICGQRGHPEVKDALIRFARWLRQNYDFPIRVPVYLRPDDLVMCLDGSLGASTFFAPWDMNDEPYIRIATGSYENEKKEHGRDNALAGYLVSLAYQVLNYQQWVKNNSFHEGNTDEEADKIVDEYALTTDHP